MSPAERDPSEPPAPAPAQQVDPFVAPVDAALRVVAFVVAAGLVVIAVWYVAPAWGMFVDWWAGRAPMDTDFIWKLLAFAALLLLPIRKLLLAARHGVEPGVERGELAAIESRAFLEAVERHDRLRMEAQRVAAEEAGGGLNRKPTGRGYEAGNAARMKERREA
jgi:hypothetical protein